MDQIYTLILGVTLLILGVPIGNLLAKLTKEELAHGKKWFVWLIIFSLTGAVVFLILRNDALLFGLLFTAIVTSRSLKE